MASSRRRSKIDVPHGKGGLQLNNPTTQLLTSDTIQMLVASMTASGKRPLTELEAERFLNALTRAQQGVPTGVQFPNGQIES